MANVHCFTSITFSYLAKARVLAWSLKRFHPDWTVWVCITDREPPGFHFDIDEEHFDKVIWADELPLDNFKGWLFKHDVVEACTAVKGLVLSLIAGLPGDNKIFYFDPDIAVFSPLDSLLEELQENDILITPHQLTPEHYETAIVDNEISSLQHGIYNLGFVGINNSGEGIKFANWWCSRLEKYCYNEIPAGLFVDQRWCDLIPAFFENVKVLRDAGCNVASWNLSQRDIAIEASGDIRVNKYRLKFFHFTKIYGSGLYMINKYAKGNIHVFELVSWYKKCVEEFTSQEIDNSWWYYGKYSNGKPVLKEHRLLYRSSSYLQDTYRDPFSGEGFGYYQWLSSHEKEWKNVFQVADEKENRNEDSAGMLANYIRGSRWTLQCKNIIDKLLSREIKEIIVYGAGEVGRTLIPIAKRSGIKVRFVVDRNPLFWGQHIEGAEIGNLQMALHCGLHTYVIASFAFTDEIFEVILKYYRDQKVTPEILIMTNGQLCTTTV